MQGDPDEGDESSHGGEEPERDYELPVESAVGIALFVPGEAGEFVAGVDVAWLAVHEEEMVAGPADAVATIAERVGFGGERLVARAGAPAAEDEGAGGGEGPEAAVANVPEELVGERKAAEPEGADGEREEEGEDGDEGEEEAEHKFAVTQKPIVL